MSHRGQASSWQTQSSREAADGLRGTAGTGLFRVEKSVPAVEPLPVLPRRPRTFRAGVKQPAAGAAAGRAAQASFDSVLKALEQPHAVPQTAAAAHDPGILRQANGNGASPYAHPSEQPELFRLRKSLPQVASGVSGNRPQIATAQTGSALASSARPARTATSEGPFHGQVAVRLGKLRDSILDRGVSGLPGSTKIATAEDVRNQPQWRLYSSGAQQSSRTADPRIGMAVTAPEKQPSQGNGGAAAGNSAQANPAGDGGQPQHRDPAATLLAASPVLQQHAAAGRLLDRASSDSPLSIGQSGRSPHRKSKLFRERGPLTGDECTQVDVPFVSTLPVPVPAQLPSNAHALQSTQAGSHLPSGGVEQQAAASADRAGSDAVHRHSGDLLSTQPDSRMPTERCNVYARSAANELNDAAGPQQLHSQGRQGRKLAASQERSASDEENHPALHRPAKQHHASAIPAPGQPAQSLQANAAAAGADALPAQLVTEGRGAALQAAAPVDAHLEAACNAPMSETRMQHVGPLLSPAKDGLLPMYSLPVLPAQQYSAFDAATTAGTATSSSEIRGAAAAPLTPSKRKRGRPPKNAASQAQPEAAVSSETVLEPPKRKRGRPPKHRNLTEQGAEAHTAQQQQQQRAANRFSQQMGKLVRSIRLMASGSSIKLTRQQIEQLARSRAAFCAARAEELPAPDMQVQSQEPQPSEPGLADAAEGTANRSQPAAAIEQPARNPIQPTAPAGQQSTQSQAAHAPASGGDADVAVAQLPNRERRADGAAAVPVEPQAAPLSTEQPPPVNPASSLVVSQQPQQANLGQQGSAEEPAPSRKHHVEVLAPAAALPASAQSACVAVRPSAPDLATPQVAVSKPPAAVWPPAVSSGPDTSVQRDRRLAASSVADGVLEAAPGVTSAAGSAPAAVTAAASNGSKQTSARSRLYARTAKPMASAQPGHAAPSTHHPVTPETAPNGQQLMLAEAHAGQQRRLLQSLPWEIPVQQPDTDTPGPPPQPHMQQWQHKALPDAGPSEGPSHREGGISLPAPPQPVHDEAGVPAQPDARGQRRSAGPPAEGSGMLPLDHPVSAHWKQPCVAGAGRQKQAAHNGGAGIPASASQPESAEPVTHPQQRVLPQPQHSCQLQAAATASGPAHPACKPRASGQKRARRVPTLCDSAVDVNTHALPAAHAAQPRSAPESMHQQCAARVAQQPPPLQMCEAYLQLAEQAVREEEAARVLRLSRVQSPQVSDSYVPIVFLDNSPAAGQGTYWQAGSNDSHVNYQHEAHAADATLEQEPDAAEEPEVDPSSPPASAEWGGSEEQPQAATEAGGAADLSGPQDAMAAADDPESGLSDGARSMSAPGEPDDLPSGGQESFRDSESYNTTEIHGAEQQAAPEDTATSALGAGQALAEPPGSVTGPPEVTTAHEQPAAAVEPAACPTAADVPAETQAGVSVHSAMLATATDVTAHHVLPATGRGDITSASAQPDATGCRSELAGIGTAHAGAEQAVQSSSLAALHVSGNAGGMPRSQQAGSISVAADAVAVAADRVGLRRCSSDTALAASALASAAPYIRRQCLAERLPALRIDRAVPVLEPRQRSGQPAAALPSSAQPPNLQAITSAGAAQGSASRQSAGYGSWYVRKHGGVAFFGALTAPDLDASTRSSYQQQARQVLQTLDGKLREEGCSAQHLLTVTVLLKNADEGQQAFMGVWSAWADRDQPPAMTIQQGASGGDVLVAVQGMFSLPQPA